jgi:lysophospholipase L1-like esterase
VSWWLSPAGWPAWTDSDVLGGDLSERGYTLIDASQVQPAIDAYHAGAPAPTPPDFVDTGELDAAVAGLVPGSTATAAALRASFAGLTEAGAETLSTQKIPALRAFHAALGNAASAPCDILTIGDSIFEGYQMGSANIPDRAVNQLVARLRALFQPAGVAGGSGFAPSSYAAGNLVSPATTGGPAVDNTLGLGGRSLEISSTAKSVTFSVSGTSVDILWMQGPSAGSFSYKVDGGTATTVTCTGGTAVTDAHKTRVTFGTRGAHTVTITGVSGFCYIDGLMVYDGDESAGIRLWDASHTSWATTDYTAKIAASTGQRPLRDQCATIQPALVIIQLLTNDWLHNLSSAAAQTALQQIIGEVRAGCTIPPSIVLTPPYQGSDTGHAEPWASYVQVAYSIAAADAGATVCDLGLRMPAVAGDVLGLYTDAVHPNVKGHRALGNYLAGFVQPR